MSVDGRLYQANSSQPLVDNSVLLRIQVLNPAKTCILYEEEQTVSTLSSSGYFNVRVGSPTAGADSLKRSALDSGNSMMEVFQNQNTAITGLTSGAIGCSYTPGTGDSRFFRFIVTPSTTGVTSTLSPDMTIDSVPQALVAESLQGLSTDDFIQVSANVTQAKAENIFGASYAGLTSLLAGSSSLYLQSTTNGTVIPSRPSDPASPTAGQIWYDSTTDELKYYDGTAVQTVGSGSGADPTKLPLAGGTMAGAIDMGSYDITSTGHITQSAQRTLRLGGFTGGQETTLLATPLTGGQEGTAWYNTTTDKLMYWDGTAAQEVLTATTANSLVPHCNPDESLEMSVGPTYVWSCVPTTDSTKLALTGGSVTGPVVMTAQNQLRLADSAGGEYAAIQAPATIGANYVLTLPDTAGSSGQVLQTDGTGVLSWIAIPSAPVTSVFGRTGAVVAATSDYDAVQVDNTPSGSVAAVTVQAAIDELDTEKVPTTRTLTTAADSGISGGGDLSANRTFVVDITGTTALGTVVDNADEVLIYDVSGSVRRKATRSEFVLSEAEVDAMVSDNGYLSAEADTLDSVVGRGADTAVNITMNTQAQVRFADSAGGEYAAIQAPATIGANYVLTLPDTVGSSGQVLQTDGTGVLSWVNQSSVANDSLDFDKFADAMTLDASTDIAATGSNVLSVTNSGTGNSFVVNDQAVDTSPFVIDASGNVGIGTTAPGTLLDVAGAITSRPYGTSTGNTGQLIMRELAAGGTETATIRAPDAITTSYALTLPTTAGSSGQVLTTDGTGILSWVSSLAPTADSLDFTHFADAMTLDASTDIAVSGTNVLSVTNSGSGNSFVVNDAAGDTSPFVIDATGSVGIGTTNPAEVLHVSGGDARIQGVNSSGTSGSLSLVNTAPAASGVGSSLGFIGQGSAYIGSITGAWEGATNTMGSLRFVTNNSGALQEQMRISSTGLVGIGTTVPGTILDVAGAITSRPFGSSSGNTGQLILRELAANGTNTVTIRSPDANAADYVLTLPIDDGSSGQVLQTDGSGVLSWVSGGSLISADTLDFTELKDSMTLDASTDIAASGTNELSITNTGTGNSFVVNDQAADTTPFVIDASGNVGIGTTSPTATLDVAGSVTYTATTGLGVRIAPRVSGDTTGFAGVSLTPRIIPNAALTNVYGNTALPQLNNSAFDITNFEGNVFRTDTTATYTGNITNANIIHVLSPSHSGSGTVSNVFGLKIDDLITGTNQYGIYQVGTNDINYLGGRLGLGTTTPASGFHLHNSAGAAAVIISTPGTGDFNSTMSLMTKSDGTTGLNVAGTKGWHWYARSDAYSTALEQNDLALNFYDGTTATNIMYVDSLTGNVGIGTTNPQSILDVYGTGTTNSAMIIPRDTTANRPSVPVEGMLRYNTTTKSVETYADTTWTGQSQIVATVAQTGQGANIGATTIITPTADGYYRAECVVVVTRVATTSSTSPTCTLGFTDSDANTAVTRNLTSTNSGNTLGLAAPTFGNPFFYAKGGTAIQYSTTGYASSGATSMQYSIRIKLTRLP